MRAKNVTLYVEKSLFRKKSLAHISYILTTNETCFGCFALLAKLFSDIYCLLGSSYCQFTSEKQGKVGLLYCKVDWKELAGPEQTLASSTCGHAGLMCILK